MGVNDIIARISPSSMARLADVISGILWHTPISRQRLVLENLRCAFPETADAYLLEIGRRSLREMIFSLLELLYWDARWKVNRESAREELLESISLSGDTSYLFSDRPVLVLTAHYSNFTLMAGYISMRRAPVGVILKRIKNTFIQSRLDRIFSDKFLIPLYIDDKGTVHKARSILSENGVVITLLDQHFGRKGRVKVDFFGRPAYAAAGMVRLARRMGADIVPAFARRRKQDLIIEVLKPIWSHGMELSDYEIVQRFTNLLEDLLREEPIPWAWMHRRWKV